MTKPKSPTQNQNNNARTLTLLPHKYKNELFIQNLEFLKVHQPTLFNAVANYKCKEYRLCSNPDGSPNILEMKSKQPLYPSFTLNDIMNSIRTSIEMLSCNILVGDAFILGGEERWRKNNPIQVNMLNKLYEAGIFHDLELTPDNLTSIHGFSTDYFPLIRVYGIGLGYHFTELIKQRKISYMTIYEPHVDLFFTSLYTIPWQLIFKYFDNKGKGVNLVIGETADAAIKNNVAFLSQRLMPLTTCYYRFNHFNSEKISAMTTKEPQSDTVESQQRDAGWYEDQVTGFYLSARNIKKSNRFFSGKKTKRYFRAFIVGSGPSLNETIDYIKTHQNKALIFSCGSAITPLLTAGIIPDYQIVQERVWHLEKHEEKHDLNLLKKISLLKLNVVSPRIDKFYKETLIFQKYRDPGSSLLGNNYAVTTGVNPTVTNTGISMCAALGVNEVYLFGVDYGAPKDSEKMHAANTMYDDISADDNVEKKTTYDLPGNLGSVIRTDIILSWSHQTTEIKVAEFPNIQWFNVGEGALISGAIPMKSENLPKKFSKKIQKSRLCEEISNCFDNNYSTSEVLKRLRTTQMQQINEYFHALLGFSESTPQTREEVVNVLSLLYKAVNVGANISHFLPSSLLSYGFKQFITDVYIQSAMAVDDGSASQFFKNAKGILAEYIADIDKDLIKILDYIERDSETDLIEIWPSIFDKPTSKDSS